MAYICNLDILLKLLSISETYYKLPRELPHLPQKCVVIQIVDTQGFAKLTTFQCSS